MEELERGGVLQSIPAPASRTQSEIPEVETGLPGMIGDSEVMQRVYAVTRLVARRNTSSGVILGQSGTGKDLVAQAIHLVSPRRSNPFVVINCAAIPEALLEAELFGYVKGAFTGAVQSRMGRIHAAQGGTLFLDEIGEMPLALQSKLLRFLEQGEVQRLGSNDNFRVDVRVIAATNVELRKRVDEGAFREDLYYRLAVFSIKLPLLSERLCDLPRLACSFALLTVLPRGCGVGGGVVHLAAAHLARQRARVAQRDGAGEHSAGRRPGDQALAHHYLALSALSY